MKRMNLKMPLNYLATTLSSRRAIFTTVFLTLLFSLPLLVKAEMRLSASVDKDVVAINDTLRLTITVQASSKVNTPAIPNMKDFDLYSAGQNEKMTWTNGKTSYYLQFSYVLTPKRIGKTQIPAIVLFEGNEKRLTPAINIEVLDEDTDIPPVAAKSFNNSQTEKTSSKKPNINDLIFFTATTNKKSAYINEQINLSLKFYTAIPLINNPQYMPPKLEGFIPEELPPIRTGQTTKKGRTYDYHEIKTALFGIDKGIAIVNPASISAMIQKFNPQDLSGSGFFQQFFSRVQGETKQIKSQRLKIKILPLPEKGQPASFNGAVGYYKISASLERTDIKAGEAVNLILTINGQGNLKTITMPELPEMSNFRIYDTVTSLSMNKDRDIIGGQKVFTTIMMPRISGSYKIKPIKFSFFNPKTKKYVELKTKPLKIKVAKGQAIASSTDYYQDSKTNYSQIKTIATDIHYILVNKKIPLSLKISQKIASVLWLNFTFLLILVGSLLFAYINGFRLKNPDLLKSKRAYKKSLKEIYKAEIFAREEKYAEAVSLLHNSLNAYLSAKLRNKTGALTIKKIIIQIKEKNPNINDNATADLKILSDELEMLRFAPASIDKEKINTLSQNYEKTLKFFEKELK